MDAMLNNIKKKKQLWRKDDEVQPLDSQNLNFLGTYV